ncbi:MAG: hypothetical protein P4M09_13130 [Devosia sp.]|nr:hypothetical protein [Devosia sp.]
MAKTPKIPPVEELLVEDDASRFADSLSPAERRADFESNGIGSGSESLSAEETEAMLCIFAPK